MRTSMRLAIGIVGALLVILGVIVLVTGGGKALGWTVLILGAAAALLGVFSRQPTRRV
jgi:hypothetical protein